jgi:hypothetical protein
MFGLCVHFFFTNCPDAVHWQADSRVKRIAHDEPFSPAVARNRKSEGVNLMNAYKQLLPRTILVGSLGLAAMLLFSTPSCKAQEIAPDHFTETGVQNVHENAPVTPAKVATPGAQQKQFSAQAHKRQSLLQARRKRHTRVAKGLVAQSRP